ncbi:MAG: hypothetical protein P1P88_20905 [Bacteroidales bacterium]|nr:hypothetical protein [Bacteroidales bacterium]
MDSTSAYFRLLVKARYYRSLYSYYGSRQCFNSALRCLRLASLVRSGFHRGLS